jgi:dihydroflavonol-4-reductase
MNVEMVKGDITDPGSLRELCRGVEVVFHLAARISLDNREPGKVYAVNVLGTENMIRASRDAGVGKFIHFSSVEAMQTDPENLALDESRALIGSAKNIYGYTKAESEKLVLSASGDGMDTVVLSPTAVVGPYDFKKSFSGNALIRLYRNSLPFLVSGGYDWVDVRDVVRTAIRSVEAGRSGEKYLLGGHYCSVKELAGMISELSGNPPSSRFVPVSLARLAAPCFTLYADMTGTKPLYTSRSLDLLAHPPTSVNSNKAKAELNHVARPLEETLRDTIDWYKEHKYIR